MLNILIVLFLVIASDVTYASPQLLVDGPRPSSTLGKKIIEVAAKYAEAVSCVDLPPRLEWLLAMQAPSPSKQQSEGEYLVFWYGDYGCSGGNGSNGFLVASVKTAAFNSLVVDPKIASHIGINTRALDRIQLQRDGALSVDYRNYDAADALCCPSRRLQVTINRDKQGNWNASKPRELSRIR